MRDDYLFRGKRIDGGGWVYGLFLAAYGRQAYIVDDYYEQVTGGQWYLRSNLRDECYAVYPDTVGRCTGLRDKNGTLIFEGDVVKLCDTNPILFVVSVEMRKYGWACVFRYADDNKIVSGAFLNRCEVIGNINDNPELMGGVAR